MHSGLGNHPIMLELNPAMGEIEKDMQKLTPPEKGPFESKCHLPTINFQVILLMEEIPNNHRDV